jgi:hypothetical protein
MNQTTQQVLSRGQQNKFQQLQEEVSALEQQVKKALVKQLEPVSERNAYLPIPLVCVSDRIAKTGIKLAHDNSN